MTENLGTGAGRPSTSEPLPIRAASQLCRKELDGLARYPSLQESRWAENRASDFNLWVSGIGACANESNCLDKRLERDNNARKVVITALSTLAIWTAKCGTLAEVDQRTARSAPQSQQCNTMSAEERSTESLDDMTLAEAKHGIEELLSALVDLEIAVRRAGTTSRVKRADRTFNKRKDQYGELYRHLGFILRVSQAPRRSFRPAELQSTLSEGSKAAIEPRLDLLEASQESENVMSGRPPSGRLDQIDIDTVLTQLAEEKVPLRSEQQMLVHANVRRADRFLFYKNRQEQLRSRRVAEGSEQIRAHDQSSPTYVPGPITNEQLHMPNSVTNEKSPVLAAEPKEPARSQHSTGTTNQVSDYAPESSLAKLAENRFLGAAATTIALRASYPKPPKDKARCPYCMIPLLDEAEDMRRWK